MTQPGYKLCGNCQQTVPANALFCNYCGTQLAPHNQQGQPTNMPPQYPNPAATVAPPAYPQSGVTLPQFPNTTITVTPPAFPPQVVEQKSRVIAALLALTFGGFGAHGFYIGNMTMGVTLLIISAISIPLILILIGLLPLLVIGVVVIVQAILYLVASDADFQQKYVVEKRWF